jgi:chromosome segregation ATPase
MRLDFTLAAVLIAITVLSLIAIALFTHWSAVNRRNVADVNVDWSRRCAVLRDGLELCEAAQAANTLRRIAAETELHSSADIIAGLRLQLSAAATDHDRLAAACAERDKLAADLRELESVRDALRRELQAAHQQLQAAHQRLSRPSCN